MTAHMVPRMTERRDLEWPKVNVFEVCEDLLEHFCPSIRSFLRPPVSKKNLDQLYSSIYASQTHITIHIPKAHDMYYLLTPP